MKKRKRRARMSKARFLEINEKKIGLIQKKFGHGLTDSEKKELVKFQDLAGKYIQQMGPSEPAMSRHGRHT
ncbi:MAG: hypothetical protein A3H57_04255 [Candidatus Taylorbacteria bacterium RIFCSPLOWO2_02_FULL_43_11]|uniref:Uncharacterized protein n=1 Tax=Candidatus Taylorbacteria bacterium RIFCSPHIGHO2_02_FULL_43_32b TaxID=1802306 RepID=A0A1G2MHF4_9BACT|nr:MAG: hypothetical protein A2743_04070 [Candidatus Taylorbacteria bacterium RIFCSPHIGHO2_01_FULL_43_47]OHA23287.1 MAG: hypothetical protein A3C72_04490 [Candidatus Taylorbacteria bacterium RIFCSPHIGHO2_02_FULL_43_32b]OHA30155.1 MAG: hypothetical protein A3B08_03620 [Candidatus Taylorbacteria bacterium RIFCSPLOWO2_01_FULL_43_44]OHA36035.1 MAG: hypothetical protein A3H57_04255 [Candidatus Taylorbacteria bacterium RIFCSPLOWO2_02_FULL_43_11]